VTFPLTDVVSLSLSIAAGGVRAPNLSTPMLIAYHTHWADRVRTFYSVTSAVSAGVVAGSPLHRMLLAAFAQNPSPRFVKVGRRGNAPVMAYRLTPATFATGQTITVTIVAPDGSSRSYSQTCGGVSLDAECTALAALMNADAAGYGTAGTTELAITAVIAGGDNYVNLAPGAGASTGQIFWCSDFQNLDWRDATADPGLAADITAIRAADDNWYAGAIDSTSEAEQLVLASSLDTAGKSAWVGSTDADVRNGVSGNLFADLQSATRERAIAIWTCNGQQEYPAVAAAAKMLAHNPGATTLAMQSLSGVTAAVNGVDLSEAQLTTIRGYRGNAYIELGGVNQVDSQAGYCSATRYVDERLTLDYLAANIPVELINAMQARVSAGRKIPYTDEAAGVARAAILKILETAARWGAVMLVDPDTGENYFTFSAIPAASQTAGDKLARLFAGCEFSCIITGAVQSYTLAGTLSFV